MRKATRIVLPALSVLAVGLAAPLHAEPNTNNIHECFVSHPGAVYPWDVTSGDDLVCVDNEVEGSAGNDKYLWAPSDESSTVLHMTGEDLGTDTLSLEVWEGAWVDDYSSPETHNSMFGDRVKGNSLMVPEVIRYTSFNDILGSYAPPADANEDGVIDAPSCQRSSNSGIRFYLGDGDDTALCVTGDIFTGTGADFVHDGGWGSTVTTGDGADTVAAGNGTDLVRLGNGNDTARVRNGGVDTVHGGNGADRAFASRNDTIRSAVRK